MNVQKRADDLLNVSITTIDDMTYIKFSKPIHSSSDGIKLNECNFLTFVEGKKKYLIFLHKDKNN